LDLRVESSWREGAGKKNLNAGSLEKQKKNERKGRGQRWVCGDKGFLGAGSTSPPNEGRKECQRRRLRREVGCPILSRREGCCEY